MVIQLNHQTNIIYGHTIKSPNMAKFLINLQLKSQSSISISIFRSLSKDFKCIFDVLIVNLLKIKN